MSRMGDKVGIGIAMGMGEDTSRKAGLMIKAG